MNQHKHWTKTLALVFTCLFLQNFNIGRKDTPYYVIKKVVLDAGHGGKDTGCLGVHSLEKHNALAVTLKLGGLIQLNYPDVEVIYTRDTDVFIPLHERAKIANKANADLFISVHCNALSVKSVHGTETYVLGQHVADDNLEVVMRENSAIYLEQDYEKNYEGYDPNSPEAHIIGNMLQNAFLEQSVVFADMVQKQANIHTGLRDRGVKQAGFLVLRETAMPSVLVETGYLTNRNDEDFLASDQGQERMAQSIFEAFKLYKLTYESHRGNQSPPVAATPAAKAVVVQAPAPEVQKQMMPIKIQSEKEPSIVQVPTSQISAKGGEKKEKKAKVVNKKTENAFTILLKEAEKPLDKSKNNLDILPNVRESKQNGKYQYFVGNFATSKEAERFLSEIINLGFQEAKIIKTY